jgi:hypothetical protein
MAIVFILFSASFQYMHKYGVVYLNAINLLYLRF